jgi:hypothetical protein
MKKQMNEARGVPENISKYSKIVFDKVLSKLKNNNFFMMFNSLSGYIDAPYKFLKDKKLVEIDRVLVNINFDFQSSSDIENIVNQNPNVTLKTNELLLTSFSMGFEVDDELTKDNNLKINRTSTPTLQINLLASDDLDNIGYNVYELLKNNYNEVLSKFGHEIMHYINMEAKGEDDLALRAKYLTVANSRAVTDTETLNEFVFNLYYLISTENIVRPSELITFLESKKITKKQFLQSYYDSEIYKTFNICENTKYEKLYNNLDVELKQELDPQSYNDYTKDDIISKVLKQTLSRMIYTGRDFIKKVTISKMPNSSLDETFEVFSKKFKSFLENHLFIKYKSVIIDNKPSVDIDTEKTYRAIIKDMNITATKMKKKLAKIYEDIPNEYEN